MPSTTTARTGTILARAAASGLAGAALSVERHTALSRGLGLAFSAGLGVFAALAAGNAVALPSSVGPTDGTAGGGHAATPDESAGPATVDTPRSPAAAVALGLGIFALSAGASELGLRAQRRLERWAGRTTGRPRLTIGLLTGAASLGIDLIDRAAERAGSVGRPTSRPAGSGAA